MKPFSLGLRPAIDAAAERVDTNHNGRTSTSLGAVLAVLAVAAATLFFGAQQASAQTRTPGIDVSRWQGTVNWTSVRNSGVRYAFAQATRGMTSPNDNFVANMNNGKAAGLYMGAYHFAFPAETTPEVQADYFWSLAGPYIKADGKTLMPLLDMESWVGHMGATSYTDWANKWCNRVIAKAAAQGVTIKPIIYSSACFMCNFNSGIAQWGSFIANYNGQSASTGSPWSSCANCNHWGTWHFWQYTDTGSVPGVTGNCDKDMFNGSVTTLVNNWVATATAPPPPTGPVIVDNSSAGFSASTGWSTATSAADKYGSDYRYRGTAAVSDLATWTASLPSTKTYIVSAWWSQGSNRSATAPYTVVHASGSATVQKNQQLNGGSWQSLGSYNMNAGSNQVRLSCWTTTGFVVMADAIKWE